MRGPPYEHGLQEVFDHRAPDEVPGAEDDGRDPVVDDDEVNRGGSPDDHRTDGKQRGEEGYRREEQDVREPRGPVTDTGQEGLGERREKDPVQDPSRGGRDDPERGLHAIAGPVGQEPAKLFPDVGAVKEKGKERQDENEEPKQELSEVGRDRKEVVPQGQQVGL